MSTNDDIFGGSATEDIFSGASTSSDIFGGGSASKTSTSSDIFGGEGDSATATEDIFGSSARETFGSTSSHDADIFGSAAVPQVKRQFALKAASLPSAAVGRVQDAQVCPDPDNERIAVCDGGRTVKIYSREKTGALLWDATLTGFTGVVVRCAWHYHRDSSSGNKTYLLASSCDNGQLLVHQQNFEKDQDESLAQGRPVYHMSHWVVSYGGKKSEASRFVAPVTTLSWMPAGTLEDPVGTSGCSELPFVLAAGSDRLALLSGWLSSVDGGIAWKFETLQTDPTCTVGSHLVTALSWAPLQKYGASRSLIAAIGAYDEDFEPGGSVLMVFDLHRRRVRKARGNGKDGAYFIYEMERTVKVECEGSAEWETAWVRDVSWTALPHATSSCVAVAFAQSIFLLARANDGRWHLRRLQVFHTASSFTRNASCTKPPKEFDLSKKFQDIWHLQWSRHGTMLAVTADMNTTLVIRKVVGGAALPTAKPDLRPGMPVHVTLSNGDGETPAVVRQGIVAAISGGDEHTVDVQLGSDDGVGGQRRTRKKREVVTVPFDQVHHVGLVNVYDTLVGEGLSEEVQNAYRNQRRGGAGSASQTPSPLALVVQAADQSTSTRSTYSTVGDLEMWEVVNGEQLAAGLAEAASAQK